MRCYGTMKSRNLKCPAGYRGRSEMDGHNPFGNDWDAKTDKEITEQCCTKLNQCSLKLREEGLDCADYGRVPGETEHGDTLDVDPSQLSTEKEIQSACCIKTCPYVMAHKNLKCDSYSSENIQCHHTFELGSLDEPDADIKWSCCSKGPNRPEFKGC